MIWLNVKFSNSSKETIGLWIWDHSINNNYETQSLRFFALVTNTIKLNSIIIIAMTNNSSFTLNLGLLRRCPVFNRTVQYFGSLSGIKMMVIPDNALVNSSIFCATDIGTVNVRYFWEGKLATILDLTDCIQTHPRQTFALFGCMHLLDPISMTGHALYQFSIIS